MMSKSFPSTVKDGHHLALWLLVVMKLLRATAENVPSKILSEEL